MLTGRAAEAGRVRARAARDLVYGLVLTVAGVTELHHLHTSPGDAALVLLAGAGVLAVAHAYSHLVGRLVGTQVLPDLGAVGRTARAQAPLVAPAVLAAGALALAAGLTDERTGYRVVQAAGLACLGLVTGLAVRRGGAGPWTAALAAATSMLVGILVVLLEVR